MERIAQYRVPLLATVGVLIVAAVVFLAWISPEGKKLTSLHTTQAQLQAQQLQLRAEIASLNRQKADMGPTCAILTKDVSEIPGAPDVDNFLDQVTALAVASGDPNTPSLTVTEAPSSAGGATGVTPVAVTFTLDGTYGQMSAFLEGLYSFPRLFTISSAEVSGGPVVTNGAAPAASTPNYDLTITGSIYYSSGQQDTCTTSQ
jgi:Tfp pilus assembly protein PilO